jgi:hypothetical protein
MIHPSPPEANPQAISLTEQLASYTVTPEQLAALLESLPSRLRKKLEAGEVPTDHWRVTVERDGLRIEADNETTLLMRTVTRVVQTEADLHCSCLLAPRCLHRGALLLKLTLHLDSAAVHEELVDEALHYSAANEVVDPLASQLAHDGVTRAVAHVEVADEVADGVVEPSVQQRTAAHSVWDAASPIVLQGLTSSGTLRLAALLRSANVCRAVGLHPLSRAALALAAHVQRRQNNDSSFSLSEATNDLRLVLADAWTLMTAPFVPPRALKSGQRSFTVQGGLRLRALATEPVIAASGYAGVVTHLVDNRGHARHLAEVLPGGPSQVAASYQSAVRVGDTTISHSRLSRAGLIMSGATVADDGRLGAGAGVKAAPIKSQPLQPMTLTAVIDTARRSLEGQTPRRLIVCHARILGLDHNMLAVALEEPLLEPADVGVGATEPETAEPTGDPTDRDELVDHNEATDAVAKAFGGLPELVVRLVSTSNHQALPANDNLRLLGNYVGLRIVMVGDVVASATPTIRLLSLSCVSEANEAFPPEWEQRCNTGLDRLEPSMIRYRRPPGAGNQPDIAAHQNPRADSPTSDMQRALERVVSSGTVALQASASGETDRLVKALQQASLTYGAELLKNFDTVSHSAQREVDGRLRPPSAHACAQAWLGAAVWEHTVGTQLAINAWLV